MKKRSLSILLITLFIISSCTLEQQSTPITNSATQEEFIIPENVTQINGIQGASHTSPLEGEEVSDVIGIVTVISGTGFYIQSTEPDNDIATSEGIFVYNPGLQKVKPGDLVLVSGEVEETYPGGGSGELSITQIIFAEYEIISSDNPLPEPIIIGNGGRAAPTEIIDDDGFTTFDPETDGLDFFESLESMLIQINNPYAVAGINKYRELAVVPDNGDNATGFSSRGTLTITETDYNPERLIIDDSLRSLPDDIPFGSTTEEPIIGVVDYTYGMFKIQPVSKPNFIYADFQPEIVASTDETHFSVAAYNVENLDALDKPIRFETLAEHIFTNLKNPDLIILSEIQDNDGEKKSDITEADLTGQKIIDSIIALGGPEYNYADIAPSDDRDGGAPGGNIRVGFLYRSDTGLTLVERPGGDSTTAVEVLESNGIAELSVSPGRIEPQSSAFNSSRKALVAEFEWHGQKLYVIGMHMNSKGGDNPLFGENQPPYLESEVQRQNQADVIRAFIDQLFSIDPTANIIVGGDLNDFQFSTPLQTIQGENMTNLVYELPAEERYTYTYTGNAQTLDHILVSNALYDQLSCFDIVHLNSEQAAESRFSDHDPVLACFNLND
ncbi:MAG: endonuclease/exonuclease/phosphatase family protein [Anaerolineaceae bacterium]|nr:endonuclease/exonuclease/phosphatase family protein [Anaerolineaceae bacterium]